MVQKLVVLGAGGFARETLDVIDAINTVSPTWDMVGYIVDTAFVRLGAMINDKPILGDYEWLTHHPDVYVVCAVGSPAVRSKMIQQVHGLGLPYATLVHPSVISSRWVTLGKGVIIAAGCVLSNGISIADHVHLNPCCTIGHDVRIGAFASLAPGVLVSGNVTLHEGAYVGTGAQVIEKKVVGEWSIVGAGATVIRDVPANTTVVGTPAKIIKERTKGWHLDENKD